MNTKTLKLIASICSFVAALYYWYATITVGALAILFFPYAVAFSLLTIGIFSDKKTILIIGVIVSVVGDILFWIIAPYFEFSYLLKLLRSLIMLVLVIAYKNNNNSLIKKIWFSPIIFEVLEKLDYIVEQSFDIGFYTICIMLTWILLCILIKQNSKMPIIEEHKREFENFNKDERFNLRNNITNDVSGIEELSKSEEIISKYKGLLESNIITQEEYDNYVKEIK